MDRDPLNTWPCPPGGDTWLACYLTKSRNSQRYDCQHQAFWETQCLPHPVSSRSFSLPWEHWAACEFCLVASSLRWTGPWLASVLLLSLAVQLAGSGDPPLREVLSRFPHPLWGVNHRLFSRGSRGCWGCFWTQKPAGLRPLPGPLSQHSSFPCIFHFLGLVHLVPPAEQKVLFLHHFLSRPGEATPAACCV